ncbi:hypothetical protein [Shewanella marisflavi]|uniref:hypothetical protein n=1 Tax=Shewanella marisflavi TaxID=260364 RepID=UPI003AAFADB8
MKNSQANITFQIPCSKEQADTIIEAFNESDTGLENYLEDKPANAILGQPQVHRAISSAEFSSWGFEVRDTEEGVSFHAKGDFDITLAATFTQATLIALDLDVLIQIAQIGTGGNALEIASGTKACVVTKELITIRDIGSFFDEEVQAFNEGDKYFECSITELNMGTPYEGHFLMPCSKGQDPQARLASIFLEFGGEGTLVSENYVRYSDGLAATDPSMRQISVSDYYVASSILKSL